MARYIGPVCRLCRAEGRKLFLKGDRCRSDKCPINKKRLPPGKAPKTRLGKKSEYAVQLREKQALKRNYGLMEQQFRNTFEKALGLPGKTGDNLIILLERRLDNVVYRLRFASSRAQARQLVNHGHIAVNGKRVNIASYLVRAGDVISVIGAAKKMESIRQALEEVQKSGVMPWLEVNADEMTGRFVTNPQRQDVTDIADIKEQLVVELYSK
ncbi:MAG: 30S ribosomal protein S4 [Spirochaetia bacterium]|jgi:small subunit ribosomal protein S4|uniref:Small ribosomal subunit protein uS4 n=1 Tax=uncultured spirochete TaxID=156406 RepID=A0A3P3XJZ8_9SPIR|nr:30S ribosomal protein S4 [Rectinema subterraneum]MDQ7796709.1 30S ribosomal protein S4 [Spirochaetia bacterium]SLM14286.1 30S ribosomal subunit protein S4 [uncultured spirochete]HBE45788.1 30S ribosomal protein S4 [Spirochaetaceae bacterium]HCX96708.1 30S ribosomal protein S4 [Spirochaetaceae bacterium]